ncbi:MAG: metallophosphoesterase family protein [Candidatus Bipolaricaulota bacterium]|nr:metallophosphoesterase family protein [Candidatus Bipolaricaulota bacterium]
MRAVAPLLGLLLGVLLGWGSPLRYGPWTGAPEARAVTVSWVASPASPAAVEYGPLRRGWPLDLFPLWARYVPAQTADWGIAHVRLEGLEPGTWYTYRVVFLDGSRSPVGTFRTAPYPGEPVTFAVLSDTQWQWTGPNRVRMVAEALGRASFAFHFVLHGGDLVETPIPSHWEFFFSSLAPVLRWAPILPVLGNHERDSISYYEHFALPPGGGRLGKRWWTLRWGDVVVVGLDSNARSPRDYLDQAEWLRASLSGPEPHRFVVFHHPVFSSDRSYGPGSEGLQALWHPLFVELGVDLVFTGHAHNYERIERDGVTYLVCGGGGANLYPLGSRVPGSVAGSDEYLFYVPVRAGGGGVAVEGVGVARVGEGGPVPGRWVIDAFVRPDRP